MSAAPQTPVPTQATTSMSTLPAYPAPLNAAASACVVIPHYRATLRPLERFSLQRCMAVLGRHRCVLAVPDSIAVEALLDVAPDASIERFDDACFASVAGYNRMMLSDGFYARFADYDYILLHQLDALVFSDQLDHWCARGYDYIGAPWLRETSAERPLRRWRRRLKAALYRRTDRRDADGALHYSQFDGAVGNGGFSLRRIAALRAALARFEGSPRLERCRANTDHLGNNTANEDLFFGIEVNRHRRHLRIPAVAEAAAFAWESEPAQARALAGVALPFGCHAFDKLHPEFWQPLLASQNLFAPLAGSYS